MLVDKRNLEFFVIFKNFQMNKQKTLGDNEAKKGFCEIKIKNESHIYVEGKEKF
jgi:hypothetical protein